LTKDGRCSVGLSFDVGGELEVTGDGDTKILSVSTNLRALLAPGLPIKKSTL